MERPGSVPEHAVLFEVNGQTEFIEYAASGIPSGYLVSYWVWQEDGKKMRRAQKRPATPSEQKWVDEQPFRASNGSVLTTDGSIARLAANADYELAMSGVGAGLSSLIALSKMPNSQHAIVARARKALALAKANMHREALEVLSFRREDFPALGDYEPS